jgi:hypothetical protein
MMMMIMKIGSKNRAVGETFKNEHNETKQNIPTYHRLRFRQLSEQILTTASSSFESVLDSSCF